MQVGRSTAFAAALACSAWAAAAQSALPDILAAAGSAEVVILGEVHDNPAHHVTQAEVLAGLTPLAIVFEMISAEEAARITPELAADAPALGLALDWANSGWPDFTYYTNGLSF